MLVESNVLYAFGPPFSFPTLLRELCVCQKNGELSRKRIEGLTREERIGDEGLLFRADLHASAGGTLDGGRLARDIAPAHDHLRAAGAEHMATARDQGRSH